MDVAKSTNPFPWSATIGAGGGLLGMINQRKREDRLYDRSKELMGIQFGNQKALNKQGADLSYENWLRTNYPAQVEQLKKAGLSVGMMYGQSGAGGATAQTGSGGSASMGSPQDAKFMNISDILSASKIAQEVELMKAQSKKLEAEASSISGEEGTVGGSQVAANLANALNAKSQAKLNNLGFEIGDATKGDQIDKVFYEVEQLSKQNDLTVEQTNLAKEQALTQGVDRQLKRANINLSKQQITKMIADVKQGWQKLSNDLQQYGIMNQANKLRALEGKTEVDKIRQDFILGVIGKEIDLHKLNLEQQKVFASMFNGLLGSAASAVRQPSQTVIMPKR